MLVGAAKEVSAGAAGHQHSRIVTAVQQSPGIGRAALLGLVHTGSDRAVTVGFCKTCGCSALSDRASGPPVCHVLKPNARRQWGT